MYLLLQPWLRMSRPRYKRGWTQVDCLTTRILSWRKKRKSARSEHYLYKLACCYTKVTCPVHDNGRTFGLPPDPLAYPWNMTRRLLRPGQGKTINPYMWLASSIISALRAAHLFSFLSFRFLYARLLIHWAATALVRRLVILYESLQSLPVS